MSSLVAQLELHRESVQLCDAGPGRGRGLFAVRAFAAGEEIFSETALLCCSKSTAASLRRAAAVARTRRPGVRAPRVGSTVVATAPVPVPVVDSVLLNAVLFKPQLLDNFSPLLLTAASSPDVLCALRLTDVLRENAAEADFATRAFPALVLLLSMINHDCRPSAGWQSSWDAASQQPLFSVRAARELKAGDEISFGYCPVDAPTSTRRAQLFAGWHFACTCARCTGSAAQGGDDAMVLRCLECGGKAPCGPASAGCVDCGATWQSAAGVVDAGTSAALRTDALWWARDEPHLTPHVSVAIARLHPQDCELRRALRDIIDTEFAAVVNGVLPYACRLRLLMRAAETILSGSTALWMCSLDVSPIPHLVVAEVMSLAAACCCVASDGVHAPAPPCDCKDCAAFTQEERARARERAALCFGDAARAARLTARSDCTNQFARAVETAAASPPLTLPALLHYRAARYAALLADTAAAGARIDARSASVLWGNTSDEND